MSYTRLRYHIVTATKHRDRVISPDIETILYPVLQARAIELGGKLLQIGGVEDHIHIVAAVPATFALANFVQALKATSSRAVNRTGLLESHFDWQRGYGAFTLNSLDLTAVIRYVANQKQHHAEGTLWTSFEKWDE